MSIQGQQSTSSAGDMDDRLLLRSSSLAEDMDNFFPGQVLWLKTWMSDLFHDQVF